jgi:hypothetical protein
VCGASNSLIICETVVQGLYVNESKKGGVHGQETFSVPRATANQKMIRVDTRNVIPVDKSTIS